MTLGKRALLLIFPVVLASYAVAAAAVLVIERQALVRLETARLQQQMAELDILYRSDATIAASLLTSLVGSRQFMPFLREADASFRTSAIATRLDATIRSLTRRSSSFIAVAIMAPDLRRIYYTDNGDDPFSAIPPVARSYAQEMLEGKTSRNETRYLSSAEGPLIVVGDLVDPVTGYAPLPSTRDRANAVVVAIRPGRFLAVLDEVAAHYGAAIVRSPTPLAPDGELSVTGRIGEDFYLRATASPAFLSSRDAEALALLGGGAILMSLLVVGLLVLLIRRFITRPVSELDRQLTEIVEGRRETVQLPHGERDGSEIRRLAQNVKRLHETVLEALRRIRRTSYTDALTGISNRAHFGIVAAEVLGRASRAGTEASLLFIDVDHFKLINDRYGHEAGDALLREISRVVDATVRRRVPAAGVAVARLSGDEFAALVPVGADTAEGLASEIVALFVGGFAVGGQLFPVGVSIGIATFPGQAGGVEGLVVAADAAMYEAKSLGRNRAVRFSDAIRAQRTRSREIQNALHLADPDREFHLVYMPIVDRRGRPSGCEALLRWTSPSLGTVGPDEFIPLAERNGLFAVIDRWVIDHALADWHRLHDAFGAGFVLSINLSAAEMHSAAILSFLLDRCTVHGVAPHAIELELTETYALENRQGVGAAIAALRDAGFRIAIDDFGAGYSFIQNIFRHDTDRIKLDRLFLERVIGTGSLQTLAALVQLCRMRDMQVVAEGVDSPEKWRRLAEAGCDFFQGFGVSPPIAAERAAPWVASWAAGDGLAGSPR